MSAASARDVTGAVIVAYHPQHSQIEQLLGRLQVQVARIVVVDNSEPAAAWDDLPEFVELVVPKRNIGVAAALNEGIERLQQKNCRMALLLDQDSLPATDLVEKLARTLTANDRIKGRLAAAGPIIRDRDSGRPAPFMRFGLPLNRRLHGTEGSVACDFLITSGTLVDLEHWQAIGPMRSDWFIDNIDLEWCFRARRKGFVLAGCFDTELEHSIGQSRRLLPWDASPRYRHHPPERLYTMMRNRVFLYRSAAPVAWIIQDLVRSAAKLALFSVLVGPRWQNAKAMLRGLRDGVRTRPVP